MPEVPKEPIQTTEREVEYLPPVLHRDRVKPIREKEDLRRLKRSGQRKEKAGMRRAGRLVAGNTGTAKKGKPSQERIWRWRV
jgi:hypothetical protein